MLQSVIIGLKECWGRGGGLEREGKPNNYPTKWFLFESWGGGGGGGGNTTPKNHVRSSLIERNYLKCWQNTDSLSGKENKTRMKA